MSKKLFYLLGIVATIILGTLLYLQFCCNCCMPSKTDDNKVAVKIPVQELNPFVLSGSGINYQCNDNMKFLVNDAKLIMPISDSIKIGLENLKSALIGNPKQKITIKGYAISTEKNTTNFDNLGLARANDIKAFFLSQGFSESQFDIKGEITDSWQMLDDTISGPVNFKFNDLDLPVATNSDELSLLKDKITANPLTLYFNTNQSKIKLTPEEYQKLKDIASYTKQVSEASVLIVGHSDNVGNYKTNTLLAQKRADFVKNFLVKNGIKESRIEIQSKGPDEPVADNKTANGKARNRRTVVTIK
ncbi:OmpA family protein [Flavobacterium sp. LHD-80]|uniref:OmpA family protein n=1 Tax=Flavobacterium sp. LHD-80 TaxID=3071411 RepID=UPI0027E0F23C|nr:OmpA family protein [Flavobacterium sp. LHD-80]MDQ6472925.1 OmpA family protein [Flavobacterium sp. LHD-80]